MPTDSRARSGAAAGSPQAETAQNLSLERQSWHNWILLMGTMVTITLGLVLSVGSLIRSRGGMGWAWAGSEYVLLGGLALVVILFVSHLTLQRWRLTRIHNDLILTRERAMRSATRHYDRLMAVCSVSQAMASENAPQAVFDSITRTCFGVFKCDRVSLMLRDRATEELEIRAALGHDKSGGVIGARQKIGQGIAGWVAEHREPLVLGETVDASRFPGFEPKKSGLTAALVVPIVVRDELVGVISLSSREPGNAYDQQDLQALQVFAWNAGLCIRHAEQTGWMRQTIWNLEDTLRQREQGEGPALRTGT
jgi:hypothetical protein